MQANQTVVDDHRNMLMLTKSLSDFQENNLKSWAFIFLDNVDKVKISWNFIRKNKGKDFYPGKITFDISFKAEMTDLTKAKAGMDMLIASTKFLFWSETEVIIKKSGKKWTINLPKEPATLQPKN